MSNPRKPNQPLNQSSTFSDQLRKKHEKEQKDAQKQREKEKLEKRQGSAREKANTEGRSLFNKQKGKQRFTPSEAAITEEEPTPQKGPSSKT